MKKILVFLAATALTANVHAACKIVDTQAETAGGFKVAVKGANSGEILGVTEGKISIDGNNFVKFSGGTEMTKSFCKNMAVLLNPAIVESPIIGMLVGQSACLIKGATTGDLNYGNVAIPYGAKLISGSSLNRRGHAWVVKRDGGRKYELLKWSKSGATFRYGNIGFKATQLKAFFNIGKSDKANMTYKAGSEDAYLKQLVKLSKVSKCKFELIVHGNASNTAGTSKSTNDALSSGRAKTVYDFLKGKYSGLSSIPAKFSTAITPNHTVSGSEADEHQYTAITATFVQ